MKRFTFELQLQIDSQDEEAAIDKFYELRRDLEGESSRVVTWEIKFVDDEGGDR